VEIILDSTLILLKILIWVVDNMCVLSGYKTMVDRVFDEVLKEVLEEQGTEKSKIFPISCCSTTLGEVDCYV